MSQFIHCPAEWLLCTALQNVTINVLICKVYKMCLLFPDELKSLYIVLGITVYILAWWVSVSKLFCWVSQFNTCFFEHHNSYTVDLCISIWDCISFYTFFSLVSPFYYCSEHHRMFCLAKCLFIHCSDEYHNLYTVLLCISVHIFLCLVSLFIYMFWVLYNMLWMSIYCSARHRSLYTILPCIKAYKLFS